MQTATDKPAKKITAETTWPTRNKEKHRPRPDQTLATPKKKCTSQITMNFGLRTVKGRNEKEGMREDIRKDKKGLIDYLASDGQIIPCSLFLMVRLKEKKKGVKISGRTGGEEVEQYQREETTSRESPTTQCRSTPMR